MYHSTKSLCILISTALAGTGVAGWEAHDVGFPADMNATSYSVVDSLIVWVVGGRDADKPTTYHGFSRTIDGGQTWVNDTIDFPGLELFYTSSIHAISDSVAWVTMSDQETPQHRGRVLKTIDAGQTWDYQSSAFPEIQGLFNLPSFVYFFNENNGVTAGRLCQIYRTSNGGDLWIKVPQDSIPIVLANEDPYDFSYSVVGDSTLWFGTNAGRVFKSSNQGQSWTASNVGLGQSLIFASFQDELIGLATAPVLSRDIAKTTDGGENWDILTNQAPVPSILYHVSGSENTYMYGSGSLPIQIGSTAGSGFTSDDGVTWDHQNDKSFVPALWADTSTGWAGSLDNMFYKWVDGTVAVDEIRNDLIPKDYALRQNYPNPFNPSTTIEFEIPHQTNLNLKIYDLMGREVRALANGPILGGRYSVDWSGRDNEDKQVPTGIYIARLVTQEEMKSIKMVLLK